ncbi:M48 family metallopeptidase [Rhodanobacter sp. DHB23]|uniref:M48 family metallopeptidase n=1 Tax=Rhodanobacter sp. DHB23 TaxID=2775923 RepID=UPI001783F73E|nr:M48 family metallopeptidase [Rhodanobacter sp. DHB23]MBD8874100.1 M48 family metalloprotease [Rhodanobacter sp. DHB23]
MDKLVYGNERKLRAIALVLSALIWLALLVATFGIVLIYVPLIALFLLAAHSALIAHLRGNGIRISARQMPDLHDRISACSSKLGMPVPEAYLINGSGVLNAFATRFLGRNFVVLLSDIVDSMDDRPEALNFYIGHELGHIRMHHLTWGKILAPALWLPLLGAAYARAREYTCDRHGLAVCAQPEDAQYGLAALAAGKRRWRQVDLEEYSRSAAERPGFWMSLHELSSDYPWLNKRQAWLRAIAGQGKPRLGGRNVFAYLLSLFLARIPGLGPFGGIVMVCYVAILAAIAIPAYQDYIVRTEATTAYVDTAPYREAVVRYATVQHQWPESLDQMGMAPFAGDKAVSSISLAPQGVLIATLVAKPHAAPLTLELSPYVQNHAVLWSCGGDIPSRQLPVACRQPPK